jgi:hypothetical protein
MKFEFSGQIFQKFLNVDFNENSSSECKWFRADRQARRLFFAALRTRLKIVVIGRIKLEINDRTVGEIHRKL